MSFLIEHCARDALRTLLFVKNTSFVKSSIALFHKIFQCCSGLSGLGEALFL